MAAFTSAGTLQTYGTDKKINDGTLTASDKTFEIVNKGQITVNGDKSIGLYGIQWNICFIECFKMDT